MSESGKVKKLDPHETAQEELRALAASIKRLHRLADKIEGLDSGKAVAETAPDPPFKSVQLFLAELAGDYEAMNDHLKEGYNRIENALYS